MSRRRSLESQTDIEGKTETSEHDLEEQLDVLGEKHEEVEAVRDTIGKLDFGGTLEAGEHLEDDMGEVEDAAMEVFDKEDGKMEDVEGENEDIEESLTETMEGNEAEQEKLEGLRPDIETDVTRRKIEEAMQTIVKDVEFFADQIVQAIEAREQAKRTQEDLKGRVHSSPGGGNRE